MRVGFATDHGGFRGFTLKQELVADIRTAKHQVIDFGAYSFDSTDDYQIS